jgi:hypothetical protein
MKQHSRCARVTIDKARLYDFDLIMVCCQVSSMRVAKAPPLKVVTFDGRIALLTEVGVWTSEDEKVLAGHDQDG